MRSDLAHVVAAAAFAAFIAVSLFTMFATRKGPTVDRQRFASGFILFMLIVSFTPGLAHRDLWPFGSWAMMTVPPPEEVGPALPFSWLYAVTGDGAEYRIDPRALEPLSMAELLTWIDYRLPEIPRAQQRRVGALLLDKANSGRLAVIEGRPPGYIWRVVGPFRAPHHLLYRPLWTEPRDVPEAPFVAIRWYSETWNIDQRLLDPGVVTRTLGFEYRP